MRYLFFAIVLFILIPGSAHAFQMDVVDDPICFKVRNEAPYKVYGNFVTDYYMRDDGIKARHRANFRLEEPGSLDREGHPADQAEFCSYGPFLPDRKLEMVLRTLLPIFSCKTRVDMGEIVIKGRFRDEGGTETWAVCY